MNNVKVNNTKIIPLRWFANLCGSISSWAILKAAYLDEDQDYGFRYTMYSKIYFLTWTPYLKWGTFYHWDFDMSGDGWNDYDENGVPYWDKWIDWDFEDEETGDAFRLITKEK
jgi:hypothetical protein